MKNKLLILYFLTISVFFNPVFSQDNFTFDVTEVEISENGNTFKGLKRGVASTDNSIFIEADYFEYNKVTNILNAKGNVIIDDKLNNTKLFSEDITYLKNEEIIFTNSRSKALDKTTSVEGDQFEYNKILNTLQAKGNVIIDNKLEDYKIITDEINYEIINEKFFTKGETEAIIQSKYNFKSKDVLFLKKEMRLISYNKSIIEDDNSNIYKLDEFNYRINQKILKGKNILVITNNSKPKSDRAYN